MRDDAPHVYRAIHLSAICYAALTRAHSSQAKSKWWEIERCTGKFAFFDVQNEQIVALPIQSPVALSLKCNCTVSRQRRLPNVDVYRRQTNSTIFFLSVPFCSVIRIRLERKRVKCREERQKWKIYLRNICALFIATNVAALPVDSLTVSNFISQKIAK